MKPLKNSSFFLIYLVKFTGAFCLVYFGTLGVVGLSAQGGYYSAFVAHNLNYISWLRSSLLYGSKGLLQVFGFDTYFADQYLLRLKGGYGVRMVYSCLGYGVMSFWIAFIFANKGSFIKKLRWIVAGILCIWIINVCRVSLLLVAANKHWANLFGFDHHTWFTIVAYILIFALMYFFDKSGKIKATETNTRSTALPITDH